MARGVAAGPRDPRFVAAIELIGRTGGSQFQLRYSDDDEPTVWMAVGRWPYGSEAAAALDPLRAVLRLLDQVVDGGTCAHCGKPSGVTDDFSSDMPMAEVFCWYVFDPELAVFRRSCEGETEGRKFGRDADGRIVGRNDPCPCRSGKKFKRCHGA